MSRSPFRSPSPIASRRTAWIALLAVLLSLLPALPARADGTVSPSTPAVYRLVHLADSHWIGGAANTASKQVLAAVAQLQPQPQLVIHGGDVTEVGAAREYSEWQAAYSQALGSLPALYVPGNHENRWLDAGLGQFQSRFRSSGSIAVSGGLLPPGVSASNQSFDAAGVHFVLLDSTIPTEAHGHFDPGLLRWLAQDLAAVGADRPVILFFHHPVAYTPLSFTDTDDELFATLKPYNVRAIFTGHGHLNMQWQRNNISLFMTQAAYQGGFKVLDIVGDKLVVSQSDSNQPLQQIAEISLVRPETAPRVKVQSVGPGADGNWHVSLSGLWLPEGTRIYYQIDGGDWYPANDEGEGEYSGPFSVTAKMPGRHRLLVWATPPGAAFPGQAMTADQWVARNLGPSWSDYQDFDLSGGPQVAWHYQAQGGIQSPPAVDSGRVYVTDRSGRITALEQASGRVLWQQQIAAGIIGSAAPAGNRVAVANLGGQVLVLDARTGQEIWHHELDAPVIAQPLWAAGQLAVGDTAGNFYSLDAETGALQWRYKTGGTIQASATYGAGSFFVGAWDSSLYAIDAFSGQLRWKSTLPGGIYYSPANQRPLYFRGRVFVTRSQPSGGNGLYALDVRDGSVTWSAAGGFGYSAAILHGGLVLAGTNGGTVQAFDPLTGTKRWSGYGSTETFDGAVSSFGSTAVESGLNGSLVAVDAASTKHAVTWRFSTGAAFNFARPVADGNLLLAGGMDGTLWALAAPLTATPSLTFGTPGVTPGADASATFPDLGGSWTAPWVMIGKQMGLAGGFPDGGFHPNDTLTRAQQAVLIARYLGLTAPSPKFTSKFADIKGHWAAQAVMALEEKGLIAGVKAADGHLLFQPDRPVSRAEVAQFEVRLLGRTRPSGAFLSRFSDLDGHWAAPAVHSLEEMGLLPDQALQARRYNPDALSNRAEALALLVQGALSPNDARAAATAQAGLGR